MTKLGANHIKPQYNPKFHKYEITWIDKDGRHGGVWGDTKEECLEKYNEIIKL